MGAKKIFITSSIFLMAVAATLPAFAATRYTARHHRTRVRRVAWNPVLRGSMDSMVRQNEEIDRLQRRAPRTTINCRSWGAHRSWFDPGNRGCV
jgi:hypothetical protein